MATSNYAGFTSGQKDDILAPVNPPFPEHASRAAATGVGVAGAAAPSDAAGASPGEAAKASWVQF